MKVVVCFLLVVIGSGGYLSAQYAENIPICGLTPIEGTNTASLNQAGKFKGKFFFQLEKAPLKEKHTWLLYLEDEEGNILEGATIQGMGINMDAGRGFPTPPLIQRYVGNGHYAVENMLFPVGGTWTMRFQVIWGDHADVLSFDVNI
ncbi:MAG: hypothetical protein AAF824_08185 [Bacteroidota bacterium]